MTRQTADRLIAAGTILSPDKEATAAMADILAHQAMLCSSTRVWTTADEIAFLRDMAASGMRQNLLTLRALVYVRRWDAGVDPDRVAAFLDAKLGEMEDRRGNGD